MPRILVAYDIRAAAVVARHDPAHPMVSRLAELEALSTDAHDVVRALSALGHEAALLPIGRDGEAFARIDRERPDLVLDLCDTLGGRGELACALPAFCDFLGVPVAGATGAGKALGRRKHDVKAALCRAGVPTPRYQVIDAEARLESFTLDLEPPVIVKPTGEHASVGIGPASVAWDRDAATARARWLFEHGMGPVLVEEYVEGVERELLLAGDPPRVFTPIDAPLAVVPAGYPRIRTFDIKWFSDPAFSGELPPKDPRFLGPLPVRAPAVPALADDLPTIARAAFHAAGCRDWGRIDFRVDAGGIPLVIDVTPNAYLSTTSSAADSAAEAGVGYAELLTIILEGALARRSA
ncbi:D-alanine--D-alanine ligase [Minicystis rosea]|nr:D-alanine--D-alanine ligase [Minicystis rosea]